MIDITLLRQIMSHDEDRVKRFLSIFAAEVPRQIATLQSALERRDLEGISTITHGLKSQVKYLNESAIASLAAEIEDQADTGFYSAQMSEQVQQLSSMLKQLLRDPMFESG